MSKIKALFYFIVYILFVFKVHVKYFLSKKIYGAYVPLSNLSHFLFWFSNIIRARENGFG